MPFPEKPSPQPPGASVKTILVVEDDRVTRKFLCSVIEDETPYRVALASDGAQALDVVRTIQPDLLALDYLLPDMNGIELYRRLCQVKQWSAIPTIFLTVVREEFPELFSPHIWVLRKPFQLDDFLAMLTRILESPGME
ncbi:MAG: response regulator [Ktedonobacteraceae bacterium]|nr:response regulator [Ktedonobacteraceae bacterium]